jgi:hypothetical protein
MCGSTGTAGPYASLCRKTFPRKSRRTAGPSTALRSGRDDKGEGWRFQKMTRTSIEWVAQVSLLRPECSGQNPLRGETQVSKARPGPTTHSEMVALFLDRGIMGLRPTQGDEKRLSFSNYSPGKRRPPLCHLDRSAAKWRDLRFSGPFLELLINATNLDRKSGERGGGTCGSFPVIAHPLLRAFAAKFGFLKETEYRGREA